MHSWTVTATGASNNSNKFSLMKTKTDEQMQNGIKVPTEKS